ncbi:fumarylacetoacetate hydrolase family protein [Piscinibacter sakaiensis]|uniref:2-hydroxyhepta-2,4-diene-1,7-dioate isomerase/5-carboxymethyl-2-oxo-hex-3-ene-1,7-dioate decarboxylase n=1 Tax=Piscinibacter sakaiensis TaxID=1547922 RepID=A0A0K8P4W6_PISS1|nr:fumarylacetoacetate hydrolase family protein [Piscinibacter sakaiensis]GAP37584.1 2-hydroxyhepta-2,4-diene-1,7-dioate isomerase/5-carboxymethyl-2-oxo-hex-3- ene-1,7-dioate decarboxylase [Piscinibacter sakaiensis]
MKLLRFGPPGRESVGAVDRDGRLRDLSSAVPDLHLPTLGLAGLKRLRRLDPSDFPVVRGRPRLGVPFTGISKFVAIGLNYADHAAEAGLAVPAEPIVFLKATTCISGPQDPVRLPAGSTRGDWEVELGVVIGRTARAVDEHDALAHVAGYTVVNDVSEREWQLERGGTWDKGKGFDTFGPIGPWLVTADEVPDPQALSLWLDLNGEPRQRGSTATMVFGVARLVSYVSRVMTLLPGDVIATGTPPGVGMGMKPPRYLRTGDVMTLGIEGLGSQRQRVI